MIVAVIFVFSAKAAVISMLVLTMSFANPPDWASYALPFFIFLALLPSFALFSVATDLLQKRILETNRKKQAFWPNLGRNLLYYILIVGIVSVSYALFQGLSSGLVRNLYRTTDLIK